MGILDYVGTFGAVMKVSGSFTRVDSTVFQMHYRWTATVFFIAAAVVSASEFMGDPIHCIYQNKNADKPYLTWCWISSTYTLNTTGSGTPGLKGIGNNHGQARNYHAYYQWVPLVLFFMGCAFYVPHMLWKAKEGKRVHNLLQGLQKTALFQDTDGKIEQIVKYMNASVGLNNHYFTWYMVLEALNLVNVVVCMCLLDKFVGGVFWEYGLQVIQFINMDEGDRDDPMKYAFPRITQCSFHLTGPSGTPINREMICILPQNIMNEKIFLFLWVWMVVLTTITTCWIVWRIVVLLQPTFRLRLMELVSDTGNAEAISDKIQQMHLGDFCLLEVLSRNLDIDSFNRLLKGITSPTYGLYGSIN